MIPNPTDEIRAIKHKLAAACDNDIHRIAETLDADNASLGVKA